ncbi:hypothetical protein HHI36_023098 [Cryptolaemus montrouzieri]|uniref:LIM zinc-binding domain-containing protein n=1 Tax=Cryptolaemus montrouzieri TaxID=559131 RepID=A0ABD2PFY0_9CUCU
MDENGMENEHLEQRNSSNTEYLPTKCRVTKPPPPKPATNPLQFIKVAPPPLFQKAKEQVNKVEKIKKERKEVQDEAEDWQANLDNWKSSRRKLQEHIIERVVEVKKFEQEDNGRSRRKAKTFNEILEERGKSKYSIPIYIDESNDWSDYGISDSKSDQSQDSKTSGLEVPEQYSSDEFSSRRETSTAEPIYSKTDIKLNNNNYNQISLHRQLDSKDLDETIPKNGQYTYESAIEGYRSRIKSKIDDSILVKISELPKRNSEVEALVPKGEIVKRKELFDRQQIEGSISRNTSSRVLQDFENSISIKQRLKSLEKCNDQTVKHVDNINIIPKVKQISQLFNKPCTENMKNNYNDEVSQNNNTDYPQRREKLNINIVPWVERDHPSDTSEIDVYVDKNDSKEVESQSDDKSSDTFYSGLEDTNYPPSVSSTDYMALSSDREDSGIHTADVSCSVSQADDTAEELESNTNSHENTSDDFQLRQKYFKDTEDNNNIYGNHILKLTKENIINQTNTDSQENDTNSTMYNPTSVSSFSQDVINSTVMYLEAVKEPESQNVESKEDEQAQDATEPSELHMYQKKLEDEVQKALDSTPSEQNFNNPEFINISDPFTENREFLFNPDFPLHPTKMVEPPKVKPPPPPVFEDEEPLDASVKRMNSTKRIKKEITLKRSSFLGLNEPEDVDKDLLDDICIALPETEQSKVEEILAKQLYESKILDRQDTVEGEEVAAEPKNSMTPEEDEIMKREREIIEMVEKAEKNRDFDGIPAEQLPIQVQKPTIPLSRTFPPPTYTQKPADASYHDKEAELRRLQDQKNYPGWQQTKHLSEHSIPNLIQRGPIAPAHGSSKSSIKKLTSVNNDVQPYLEHHPPIGPPLPVTQPRSIAVEDSQNRILSVSGKKKCSFCGNELGRGAAMIIETLCLFYHMECFKCCVCHVQLGNGLNGTDVRVRNQKLHCHNCYSSDDGVKFSCV